MKRLAISTMVICLVLTYFFIQPLVASSAEFPTKPIKLIIIFGAGGPTDICCRALARLASPFLGQEVIPENKPGAGGSLGVHFLAKSTPDGYTIGSITGSPVMIAPNLRDVGYDPSTDFTGIIGFAEADHPLSVRADSPIKTFQDFVKEARKREVTSAGVGMTACDVAMMRLAAQENLKIKIVPYGGMADALPAVLGGHTDAINTSGIYEYVRAGKLRLLVQTGGSRNPEFPDVPTLKELGYNIETSIFYGLVAPKGIPQEVQYILETAFTRAAYQPEFQKTIQNAAYSFAFRGGKNFETFISKAYKQSTKDMKSLGLGKYAKEKK